jgi:hypothetical protein
MRVTPFADVQAVCFLQSITFTPIIIGAVVNYTVFIDLLTTFTATVVVSLFHSLSQ